MALHPVRNLRTLQRSYGYILAVVAFLLCLTTAQAGTMPYGSFPAATIDYNAVEESSAKPLPLFGPPSVSGDSLNFVPANFEAQSNGDGKADFTDGTLNTQIVAHPGYFIPKVQLTESGDFTLFGDLGNYVDVAASLFIRVDKVNDVKLGVPLVIPANLTFQRGDLKTLGGTYSSPFDNGLGHIWVGGGTVDIDAALAAAKIAGRATSVHLTMDNGLTAYASGGFAFIKKKDIGGVALTVVPEPASCVLAGLGAIVAALMLGRRRAP